MKSFDDFVKEASNYKQILINYRDKGQVYSDSSFHPNKKIDEKIIEFPNPKYNWRRIDEIFRAPLFQKNLIKPEFICSDMGYDQDLLCVLTQISNKPEIIPSFYDIETVESILGKEENTINLKCGAVVIYLYAFGRRTPILVDTQIPFYKGKRRPVFCRPTDISKSAWFCLIEKAAAKLFGSYSNFLESSYKYTVYTFFSYYTDEVEISQIEGDRYGQLLKYQEENALMSVISFSSVPLPVSQEELASKGLQHFYYPIIKVQKSQDKNFICLRNPSENDKEWLGDYSDNSSLWTPQLKKDLGMKASNDGTFWMIDTDLFKYFNYLLYSEPIQANWIIKQFNYKFTPGSHDGQPFNSSAAKIDQRSNYALQVIEPIKSGQQTYIRISIEKRNLSGPNFQSKYMIFIGKFNGKKITSEESRYTFRYTITSDNFSFTYPINKNDEILTIALHRLSKSENTEECYVKIMCELDFKLYDIDKPSKPIPKIENDGMQFRFANTKNKQQPKKETKKKAPRNVIKNDDKEKTEKEKENANFKNLKLRADKGETEAMFECSEILRYGDGVDININDSIKYCKMAADKGSIKAIFKYASICDKGDGIAVNKNEALKYYRRAANKGNIKSMLNCAEMLSNGDGVSVNKKEAVRFYKMAADKGDCLSMYNYAVFVSNGDGVPQNKEDAAKYYKMAADLDDIDAMYRYAEIMKEGDDGVDADPDEALKYFKMAADKGHLESMKNLAEMFEDGIGVDENKEEAAKYYSKAADEGDVQSMFYAAVLYDDEDEGSLYNARKAAKYFKMAADKGHKESMYFYGLKLKEGEGVGIDEAESIKYIKKSADKGYSKAIEYLKKS